EGDGATGGDDGGSPPPTTEFDGEFSYAGDAPAPDFPPELEWLNVSRPLSLTQDLRGKIVVLDFWTQGCINCIHVIPDLKRLEAEYPDSLVVVGVHWAKFDRERQIDAIEQSVLRYGVEHPIVNDEFELIRNAYGVNAWPTLFLIDPLGNGVGVHSGEGVYDLFQTVVDVMSREYGAAGLIDPTPLDALVESQELVPTVLSFPGKVLADESGGRLFIADTGHHRILISDLDGELVEVIGTGLEGAVDGSFDDASFSRPQGLALGEDGNTLYIADRENHLVRAVDLITREVTTIAGTGVNAFRFEAGVATDVAIASPWDLHREGDQLFVAGAGRHQLWVIELENGFIDVFAGTGGEGLDDGHRLQDTLSQPSGFASDGDQLFFTDPEASAVRTVSFADDELATLVGDGLFSWGDEVGDFEATSLQHAIGIELVGDELYVADTYNHRIKVLDLASGQSRELVGDGTAGLADGRGEAAQLAEPSGLSATSDRLYVADTNNHQIRVVDLSSGAISTLALSNLDLAAITVTDLSHDEVALAPLQLEPGRIRLSIDFDLPDGYKYNTLGTFRFEWSADDPAIVRRVGSASYEAMGPKLPKTFDIDLIAESGTNILRGETTVFYCLEEEEAFCLIRDVSFEVPIEITLEGGSQVDFRHSLPSAEQLEAQLQGG
ncbi:MAG: thioredoxin-like domain-containing protein, partial [Actinomycetota bacterium]|nr:thioredoxin-like domain-containing protein [Actinomycetota bacterium]